MAPKILFVDDEPKVLNTFKRLLAKEYDVATAGGGAEGLALLESVGPFTVVVSDLRMPKMDGIEFLTEVKRRSPDTVRIMLTGNAELGSAIKAVNEGSIFRFLLKPCPRELLRKTLDAAVEYNRLMRSERELLEQTLSGSIKVMTEILSLTNPTAFSRSGRIRKYVMHIVGRLNLPLQWRFELAASLSLIGCVTLPTEVLDKYYAGAPLTESERQMFDEHPTVARNLLINIPRLGVVARMIGAQRQPFERRGDGDDFTSEDPVALGGHLIRISVEFDRLLQQGFSRNQAVMQLLQDSNFTPELVSRFKDVPVEQLERVERSVTIREMMPGMTLNEDVKARTGMLLAVKGQEITLTMISRLRAYAKGVGLVEPIRVLVVSG